MQAPDPQRLVGRLERLVGLDTTNPPGAELEAAAWAADELRQIGLEVELVELASGRASVVGAVANGDGPGLALASHLDVVPAGAGWSGNPFLLREHEGRLIGRGACDAKGQVAAILEAATLLLAQRSSWSGRLVVALVADEEIAGQGAVQVAPALRRIAQRVIVGEPTSLRAAIAHKGVWRPVLRVRGQAAHSGRPELGRNAIVDAARVTTALADLDMRLRARTHPLAGGASLSVTRIAGGIADNVIPPACSLVVDRRIVPGETLASAEAELRAILVALADQHGIEVALEQRDSSIEACAIAPDDPLVQAALAAGREHAVLPAVPVGFPAGCDLVRFADRGLPGIILGPGSLEQAHQPDEWIALDELIRGVLVYRDTALAWFNGGLR